MMKSLFLARGTPGMFLKGYPTRLKEEECFAASHPGVSSYVSPLPVREGAAAVAVAGWVGGCRGGNCLGISSAAN